MANELRPVAENYVRSQVDLTYDYCACQCHSIGKKDVLVVPLKQMRAMMP